jgi:hypothetical protein
VAAAKNTGVYHGDMHFPCANSIADGRRAFTPANQAWKKNLRHVRKFNKAANCQEISLTPASSHIEYRVAVHKGS